MPKTIAIRLLPSEAADPAAVLQYIAQAEALPTAAVNGYFITKSSIDARGRQPWINLQVQAFINEPLQARPLTPFRWEPLSSQAKTVIIIGSGPGGLFAALQLMEKGIRPILIERGKDVRSRRRDLAQLNRDGIINPESNYCFGEGGAGTYSDGKLYTRSTKRGDVNLILQKLHHFGADERILYESHPHIGTNKLPQIITAIREHIIHCGGEVHFETKLTGLEIRNSRIHAIEVNNGPSLQADAYILATGHSARDVFRLLHQKQVAIESKPFALGIRVEHPQSLIDTIQYHCTDRGQWLPPAPYSLVQQVAGHGVFSFCMCPGGIIAPAATGPGELVVNGWSPSKRNNPFANSGIVVNVEEKDLAAWQAHGPLAAMQFQQEVEQKAFAAGGGRMRAPAQRLADFTQNKISASLPGCSYHPGLQPADLRSVLPRFIHQALREAFLVFGKKMKGYLTNDAVVVATESRTSSPVRIPRNPETFCHPQLTNLYPCGEGAGFAGGIVSAAMDGENIARALAARL